MLALIGRQQAQPCQSWHVCRTMFDASLENLEPTIMATKRKQGFDQSTPNKKSKSPNNIGGPQSSQPPLDLTYGQRGAFPGLDTEDGVGDGGSEEDSEMDALRYLKSVR